MLLIHGENSWSSFERYKEVKKISEDKGFQITIIDGDELDSTDLLTEGIFSSDMFSSKKVIFVKRFGSNRKTSLVKDFSEYLKIFAASKQDNTNEIVFWEEKPIAKNLGYYKIFASKFKVEEFPGLKRHEIQAWAQNEAKKREINLKANDFHHLLEMTGYDQGMISNEFEKLHTLGKISSEELHKMLSDNSKVIIWDFVDNFPRIVMYGNPESKSNLINMYSHLIKQGESDILIHSLLLRQIKILVRVKLMETGFTDKDIVSQLRIPPFKLRDYKNQAYEMDVPTLTKLFEVLVEEESKLKTGQTENFMLDVINEF